MIGNFKDVTEVIRNRFAESPLGKQVEGMDFGSIDDTDDSLDVTEVIRDHFAESPLGEQVERMDFGSIDDTDDSPNVTEVIRNRFAESPLGKQVEGMDFGSIDDTDDSPLNGNYDKNEQVISYEGKLVYNLDDLYNETLSQPVLEEPRSSTQVKKIIDINLNDDLTSGFSKNENGAVREDSKGTNDKNPDASEVPETQREGLTDEEKKKIKEETGWSDEIVDAISSMEEYEIYKKAGLVEAEINGKKCLIRNDIDWEQKDAFGRTNRERVQSGKSPINKNGEVIELHHIGQHADSPLAELTTQEHRGKGNSSVLHDVNKESEIDREAFNKERRDHWQSRVDEGNEQ